ncbi:hypothetical protein HZH66_008801 [Vespula vulgaris]|uniref:Uncharacterized protein n=1 Tax=Vespula vulgaris TaxID=7454 RepID=A0A834JQ79_VESVU|nr:hypothetical protein HZH66_008801 [Vespula vulgaris]
MNDAAAFLQRTQCYQNDTIRWFCSTLNVATTLHNDDTNFPLCTFVYTIRIRKEILLVGSMHFANGPRDNITGGCLDVVVVVYVGREIRKYGSERRKSKAAAAAATAAAAAATPAEAPIEVGRLACKELPANIAT